MADDGDRASDYAQRLIEHGLSNRAQKLAGPDDCGKCEGWNDRAEDGYAVCSACVE